MSGATEDWGALLVAVATATDADPSQAIAGRAADPADRRLRALLEPLGVEIEALAALDAWVIRGPVPSLAAIRSSGSLAAAGFTVVDDEVFTPLT